MMQLVTGLPALTSLLPGLGHDMALLQTQQLRSELEALRSLRAAECQSAAVQEDLLRLPGQEQGLALSVIEPHVSPICACQTPGWWPPCATARHRLAAAICQQEAAVRRHGSALGSLDAGCGTWDCPVL